MKQRIFLLTLLFLLILTRTNDISAKETKLNEDMFTNVENTLKDKEIDLSYTQLVKQLIHGNVKGVLHTIKAKMKEGFLNRMLIQKDLIREILLIAFTAAIFKNLSDSFFQQSTANSAFYITYVILCGVMVHSFFLFKQNSDAACYLNGRLYERNDHGIFTGCCLNFRDHNINDSL